MKLPRSLAMLSLFLSLTCSAEAPDVRYIDNPAVRTDFGVGPSNICLPLKRVLLIRSQGRYYALRLDAALVTPDKGSFAAVFSVSTHTSTGWTDSTQRVEERQLRGPSHPLMFQTGNTRIKFGPFTLRFNGPTCVSMYRYNTEEANQGIAFAPTAWTSASEVRPNDNLLKWYLLDKNRSVDIRLENLPGFR